MLQGITACASEQRQKGAVHGAALSFYHIYIAYMGALGRAGKVHLLIDLCFRLATTCLERKRTTNESTLLEPNTAG